MIKINLVSEGRRPVAARKAKEALGMGQTEMGEVLFIALSLLGILAIAGTWWYLRSEIKEREVLIAEAQREVDELALVLKEVEDFKAKKAELEHKIAVINDLKAKQWGPVRIMDQVSRALPELLWLDGLNLRGSTVDVRGRAFNTNQIASFIENLNKVPEFAEPQLRETSKVQEVYQFNITFKFTLPQPEPEPEAETVVGEAPAAEAAGVTGG
jgi:type IV pilus assembly protein PilN